MEIERLEKEVANLSESFFYQIGEGREWEGNL